MGTRHPEPLAFKSFFRDYNPYIYRYVKFFLHMVSFWRKYLRVLLKGNGIQIKKYWYQFLCWGRYRYLYCNKKASFTKLVISGEIEKSTGFPIWISLQNRRSYIWQDFSMSNGGPVGFVQQRIWKHTVPLMRLILIRPRNLSPSLSRPKETRVRSTDIYPLVQYRP